MASALLNAETFSASSERDALGRVLRAISPDRSEVLYTYGEGGGLQKVEFEHGAVAPLDVAWHWQYDPRNGTPKCSRVAT